MEVIFYMNNFGAVAFSVEDSKKIVVPGSGGLDFRVLNLNSNIWEEVDGPYPISNSCKAELEKIYAVQEKREEYFAGQEEKKREEKAEKIEREKREAKEKEAKEARALQRYWNGGGAIRDLQAIRNFCSPSSREMLDDALLLIKARTSKEF